MRGTAENAKLMVSGRGRNQLIVLEGKRLRIGRAQDNDLVIEDDTVSRYHAEISCQHLQYYVTDTSRNGTFVNDVRLPRGEVRCLADGDRIQIASGATLIFQDEDATKPLSAPSPLRAKPPQLVGLWMDPDAREVWVDGKLLCPPLSSQQFGFLWLLYQNAGKVCTRDQLIAVVWSVDDSGLVSNETVDQTVARVRQRLREGGAKQEYIVTMRGHGFRFVPHS
jgi:hypothetical protein